jgi:hypothetical protein
MLTAPDVPFDMLGNGSTRLFSWPAPETRTAWLVLDRDGDGFVHDGRELFGTSTPLSWGFDGETASDGFDALRWFDAVGAGGNGDGVIDSEDPVWDLLRVWLDVNHNGVSEPEELLTLAEAGIVEISLHVQEKRKVDEYGNLFGLRARV